MATLPNMRVQTVTFQSERANLLNWRLHEAELQAPEPNEVLIRIDHFALTANNITYGVAGDAIGYWQFFPAQDPWGCIPVWGFGEVIATGHPDVPIGERLYGYYPMSTHLVIRPENVSRGGLVDGAAHRSALPPVYNQYTRVAADPAYDPAREAEQMLYRPLFTTAFFLDDFLDDNDFFGAGSVILTSASSKTSIGLAHLLHEKRRGRCQVVGLTSGRNRAFVEGLGCYDQVCAYDEIGSLPRAPSVMVDMAGSGPVRAAVHEHLADELRYSCAVGATHWDAATVGQGDRALPGPKPEMFFAPSQIQKRLAEWGQEKFNALMADAWRGFLGASDGWIQVDVRRGPEALAATYEDFLEGRADPAKGYVLSLQPAPDAP
jgi:hypothetical protein